MYSRKWTRMSYFDSVKMFKKYGLIDRYEPFQRAFHLFPIHKYERELVDFKHKNTDKEYKEQIKQDQKLVKKLIQKYPDLKYEPLNQLQNGVSLKQKNYAIRFIEKQKQYMNNGYSEKEAFQLAEKLFQDRIQRKIDQLQITEELAQSNKARSFMNYYQQQAEYESRLKVLRMQRDLEIYEKAQERLQEEIFGENQNQEDEDSLLSSNQKQLEKNSSDIYERVLYNIINQGEKDHRNKQNQNSDDLETNEQQQIANEFIQNTRNIFQKYYERAAYADKLNGLTDQEIKQQIRDSPTKIKKRTKQLIQKLEKLGVQIDANGELDLSNVPYSNVRKELENNPQVKLALMQRELEFESPLRQQYQQKADEFKKRLDIVNSELERQKQENLQNLIQLQKKSQQNQEVLQEQKQEYNNNNTEQQISSLEHQYEQEIDELQQKAKELKSLNQGNNSEGGKQEISMEDIESTQNIEQLKNSFLKDENFPLLNIDEKSYKLFETYEERQLRIEAKFLNQKIQELNALELDEDAQIQQENLLKDTVQRFRRLKYRIEQKNLQSASDLLFEEHEVFDRNEILLDSQIPYEQLEKYLNTPKEYRVKGEEDEIQDMKIEKMIEPKIVKEDLVTPFESLHEHYLKDEDSFENIFESQQLRAKEQNLWKELNKSRAQSESDLLNQDSTQDESQAQKKKSKKEDKKQLLEFIKKANQKKQKVGKVTQKVAELRKAKKDAKKKK